MNDITYRPFIRDSALGDINIQIPNLEIPVYKPRYSQPLEDDTETEVQSQVEEIRNPEPIVQETTVHKFNSKKDFKDTMLPIYERLLKSKGLNPAFAKSLVAQDGLESAWGSKPAGLYNFGGIKGKGTTKRTREVINGKDVYINDQFRNFKSLEDYANFKIDLLNNKRYKAFSGDIKEFANRVHRGGYATDPNYSRVLNKIIASAKHGGVLKFQQGGVTQGKEWVKNWYKNRRPQIKNNIQQNLKIPVPVTGTFGYNLLAHNMDLTTAVVDPSKLQENIDGVYRPWGRKIYLRTDSPSTAIHEWVHSSRPDSQIKEIDKIKDLLGDSFYDQEYVTPDEYLDDSQEIYSRLMQLRHALNIDPNHQFTNEEIDELKRKYTKREFLFSKLKGKKGDSYSTTVFDNEGNVISTDPYQPEYKYIPEESSVYREYDTNNTFELLNRYSTDGIRRMLNDVAQVPNKKNATLYAQMGLKIPKYQEPWNTLPKISKDDNERNPNFSYPVNSEYGNYIPNSNFPNLDYYHKFGQTDNKFKELADVLKPIFIQVLKEKNLPLTQVDNLIRQAALESNYGLDPRGSRGFNLGGIKWKDKQITRDWSLHKDGEKYIDFENLYDYAQYKVDLLNSRYNALTAIDTNDFIDRLHGNNSTKSNYSQDKDSYTRNLNRMSTLNKYLSQ